MCSILSLQLQHYHKPKMGSYLLFYNLIMSEGILYEFFQKTVHLPISFVKCFLQYFGLHLVK